MATFAIDIEEVISYRIEIEAGDAEEAAQLAEDMFFETDHNSRYHQWGYGIHTEFDDPVKLVDKRRKGAKVNS